VRERFLEAAWEPSPLHWMSYLDLRMRLPELLLMRVDKMCMGAGVEGRVPFLDHRLVELAFSIPTAAKTRGGNLKHLLKMAVRGVVPDEVIRRPKQGFGVPVHEWSSGRLGQVARAELERFCRDTDFLDVREVRRTLDRGDGQGTWYLLNLALWWREYLS
jgi:asparagine synthase (glutamine-hydrolysing)